MSETRGRSRRWLYWVPAIAVMVVIFVLSAQSGLRVSEDVAVEKPIRATGHLLAYATLAALLLVALSWGRQPRLRYALIAFGLAVAYALTDEFHQSFVPDRMGRLDDIVTDMIGAAIGLALAWVSLTWIARRPQREAESTP